MNPEIKQRLDQIRRGEVPEGYKKTKAGIVPVEWEEKHIGDVLTQRKTLMCVSEDAPLLSFTIEEGVIDPADKKSNKRDFLIKDMSTKKFALTEIGDIIYNPANLKFGAIHRNNLRRGVVSPIYGIFYGKQNSVFMGYLLHNQRFIDYAKIYTEGTVEKLKTLKSDTFLKLKITLPPFPEQQKIAQILTMQDKLIELQARKIEQLQALKKACLQRMFPKKGCDRPEIRFPEFTDAWEQRKVGEWGNFYYGHSCPKWSVTEDATTPCIRYGEMYTKFGCKIDRVYSYTNIPKENLKFSKGTEVLVPRVGEDPMDYNHCTWLSLANVAIGEMISVYNTEQNPLFTAIMFNATLKYEFAKRVEGGSVTNLYYEKLLEIPVSFPIIEEQKKIASFFENLDTLITLHQRKLDEEKQKKKALMQLLLTGIVRVKI